MFSSNLRKDIIELEKKISVFENECKIVEKNALKRKLCSKPISQSKGLDTWIPTYALKALSELDAPKKSNSSDSKVYSISSAPSICSKRCNKSDFVADNKVGKVKNNRSKNKSVITKQSNRRNDLCNSENKVKKCKSTKSCGSSTNSNLKKIEISNGSKKSEGNVPCKQMLSHPNSDIEAIVREALKLNNNSIIIFYMCS